MQFTDRQCRVIEDPATPTTCSWLTEKTSRVRPLDALKRGPRAGPATVPVSYQQPTKTARGSRAHN